MLRNGMWIVLALGPALCAGFRIIQGVEHIKKMSAVRWRFRVVCALTCILIVLYGWVLVIFGTQVLAPQHTPGDRFMVALLAAEIYCTALLAGGLTRMFYTYQVRSSLSGC